MEKESEMEIKKYVKKPLEIEAVQFLPGINSSQVAKWCGGKLRTLHGGTRLIIPTLEGDHSCKAWDYVIKGIKGEFYPCKREIFEESYEAVK